MCDAFRSVFVDAVVVVATVETVCIGACCSVFTLFYDLDFQDDPLSQE